MVFAVRAYRRPNSPPTPKHACMVLDLAQHWGNLFELMDLADACRRKTPSLTQIRVSCHGEWYGRHVLEACSKDLTCMSRLGRDGAAPVPDDVVKDFGKHSRCLIDMDAEVVLQPSPTYVLSTFRFVPGNLYSDEIGWIVETRPVSFKLLSTYANGGGFAQKVATAQKPDVLHKNS